MKPIYEFVNRVITGDCIAVMQDIPAASIDFIATDPPYLVGYEDRAGRRIANDDNSAWLPPAFAQMYRVLKDNRFLVSFYGWNKVDRFFAAWKAAGFRPVGHLVLRLMRCFVLFYTSRVVCKGRLTMEEIIFSLKHYWRFVDSEPLELKALSQGVDEKAA